MERMVTGDAKIDEIDMLYELSTQVRPRQHLSPSPTVSVVSSALTKLLLLLLLDRGSHHLRVG
jgi:hypothetical protein